MLVQHSCPTVPSMLRGSNSDSGLLVGTAPPPKDAGVLIEASI